MKYGKNTCRVNQDRIFGHSKVVNKRAIHNFDEESNLQDRVKTHHGLSKVVDKLNGSVAYDAPRVGSTTLSGHFKLQNDPRLNTITESNILFCGSKLETNWAFGMVLFNGSNVSVVKKNLISSSSSHFLEKRFGSFFKLATYVNLIHVVLSLIIYSLFLTSYFASEKKMVEKISNSRFLGPSLTRSWFLPY